MPANAERRGPLDPAPLGFRRMQRDDLPLMFRWLNTPHVREWYAEPAGSLEEVTAKYLSRVDGSDRTDPYLILYRPRPIGYIQTYLIRDHPAYAAAVQVEDDAAGVDLFLGEAEYVHRGLGSHVLRRFLRDIVFANPEVGSCIVGPEPQNRVAIRAYERAGFRYLKTVSVPGEPEPEHLLRITRADLGA